MKRFFAKLLGRTSCTKEPSLPPTDISKLDPMTATFTEIYRNNAWENAESRSGPGSTVARCQPVIAALLQLIEELSIRTLLDAPCGDFNWMKEVPLPGIRYVGMDIVPDLIERNRELYSDHSREFRQGDITRGPLPKADAIFCRDALVHLSEADVFSALRTFKNSGSTYLITTTFPAQMANVEIATGQWRPLNLEQAPFHLPTPARMLSDGCPHPGYTDKGLGVWRLAELPIVAPVPLRRCA